MSDVQFGYSIIVKYVCRGDEAPAVCSVSDGQYSKTFKVDELQSVSAMMEDAAKQFLEAHGLAPAAAANEIARAVTFRKRKNHGTVKYQMHRLSRFTKADGSSSLTVTPIEVRLGTELRLAGEVPQ